MKIEQLTNVELLPEGTVQNGICVPYGVIPMWFLNDDLKQDEIRRQIEDFHAKGVSGVMLHPRCYIPKTLEYMSQKYLELYKFATQCAKENGMKVVLYDEAMYPSGSAHGAVVKENADYSARGLAFFKVSDYVPENTDVVVCKYDIDMKPCDKNPVYIAVERYSGGTSRGIHEGEDDGEPFAPKSSDLLNPESVRCFIRNTHEKYYSVLSEYFGNTIIAFFTDEPSILGRNAKEGLIPWGKCFYDYYLQNGGSPEDLPVLFDKGHANYSQIYKKYKRIINKRLSESFFGQLSQWCTNHGIVLCGHPEGSADIDALSNFGIPGQDLVWRYVSPESPLDGLHSTMGKCSSDAARHRGLKRNLNECLGCCSRTGNKWDLPCYDMKWYFDWLFARGVNLFSVHAFFYSTDGKRSTERPPDVGPHSAWWEYYSLFSDYIKRFCYVLSESVNLTQTAVLCTGDYLPFEKIKYFYENQIEFNYLEEDILNHKAVLKDGMLEVEKQRYKRIVIEDDAIFSSETLKKLELLKSSGFEIMYFDGSTVDKLCEGIISPANKDIRVEQVLKDGRNIMMLFNEGEKPANFNVKFKNAIMYFPFENRLYSFDGKCRLMPRQSVMLIERQEGDLQYPNYLPDKVNPTTQIDITDCFYGEPLGDFSTTKPGFFGKTVYKAKFELSDTSMALLDLGEVQEVCQVILNGKQVGVKLWGPYVFDISEYIDTKTAAQTLEVIVTNPASNKYDKGGARSGLIGPVRILK